MSDTTQPTLLEAIQSGRCFKCNENIYKFKNDAMYMWFCGQWMPTAESFQRVEYCDNPSLQPRSCTFMEAWEHMKKYPGKDVCLFRDRKCRYHSSVIIDDGGYGGCLFEVYEDNEIIDSNDWKLIPQEEGE